MLIIMVGLTFKSYLQMKVLLNYNTSTKVRDIVDSNAIFQVIEESFGLEARFYQLQIYDEEFNEYIDLEDIALISNKSKIKIIENKSVTEANASAVIPTSGNASQPEINDIFNETQVNVDVVLDLKDQWPSIIDLPYKSFSMPLIGALENKAALSWVLSSELITHLAKYAYKFKCYPTKNERLQIIESFLNRYPYLKNDIGSAAGGWEIKLLNKLKKIRQNDTSLEVKLNREKRKIESSKVPKKIKLNPSKGEINWSPDHIIGENENSQNIHKEIMAEECKKSLSFQDQSKLESLMALTFSFRRSAINDKVSIHILINEYPAFFQERQQFNEFTRLTSTDIRETFFNTAFSYGVVLLQIFEERKSVFLKELKLNVETELKLARVDDINSQQELRTVLGLFVLPYLFKENGEHFVQVVSIYYAIYYSKN